jgi:hypothetical protein
MGCHNHDGGGWLSEPEHILAGFTYNELVSAEVWKFFPLASGKPQSQQFADAGDAFNEVALSGNPFNPPLLLVLTVDHVVDMGLGHDPIVSYIVHGVTARKPYSIDKTDCVTGVTRRQLTQAITDWYSERIESLRQSAELEKLVNSEPDTGNPVG